MDQDSAVRVWTHFVQNIGDRTFRAPQDRSHNADAIASGCEHHLQTPLAAPSAMTGGTEAIGGPRRLTSSITACIEEVSRVWW